MTVSKEYFIVAVAHTTPDNPYIMLWGPTNQGYRGQLETSGRYKHEEVMGHLNYYNNGCDTIAVPCWVIEAMSEETPAGFFDKIGDGPTHWIANNHRNWLALAEYAIATPACNIPIPCKAESREKLVRAIKVDVTRATELDCIINHIAGSKDGLPDEWQPWADDIENSLRKLRNMK